MKKFYYLETCNTCQRIMKELALPQNVELREIKSKPLSQEEVDEMASKTGSYESIFSKRARKYRGLGLHEMTLGEPDYRRYLLEDYTFLKRPVLVTDQEVVAGNAAKEIQRMKALL